MKRIEMIQTFDGQLHEHVVAAERHLDRLFGDIASRIAHRILRTEKYSEACKLVGDLIDDYRQLIKIKDNEKLEAEDDDQ
jgi:hypothetical protein